MTDKELERHGRRPLPDTTRVDDDNRVQALSSRSPLVALRHHPAAWLVPAGLLLAALLPWPYGFYDFLRLAVCTVCVWLAFAQWKHEAAVSGWTVVFVGIALLYNPLLPIHLTREIWTVLNLATAVLIVAHLWGLRRLLTKSASDSSYRERILPLPGRHRRIRSQSREAQSGQCGEHQDV